jgi:hypothetical protein
VIGLAFTTWSTARVAAITLSLSLLVEFAKFIPWLGPFRRTTMGHLLLGQVFSFGNLASYCLGVLIGCGMECLIIHPRRPGRLSWAGTHALAPGAARGANSG